MPGSWTIRTILGLSGVVVVVANFLLHLDVDSDKDVQEKALYWMLEGILKSLSRVKTV